MPLDRRFGVAGATIGGMVRRALLSFALAACTRGEAAKHGAPPVDEGRATDVEPPPVAAPPAATSGPFYEPDPGGRPVAILREDAPNIAFVGMEKGACEAELQKRGVPFAKATDTKGVLAPVWIRGPMRGVTFHAIGTTAEKSKSTLEIFDCRLVVALDEFARELEKHDIVDVTFFSAFRARAQGGCTPKYAGKQHCAALAVDVASFKKKSGAVLDVEKDFHGKIGSATCAGVAKPNPPSANATELWQIVCDAARSATFHVILTPNFNAQHKNHFHLELTPDAAWMLIK